MARFQMANGSYPIDNCSDVSDAWKLRGRSKDYSEEQVARHVRKAAKALDCEGPWDQDSEDLKQEQSAVLSTTLTLETGGLPGVMILEAEGKKVREDGTMRIKVPFYVGESISPPPPGFDKKIYFPSKTLPGIVQEAKGKIHERKQPLTVYARHAHATSEDHLPIGAIVDLEEDGRIGYAVIDVAPTSLGKDAQILLERGHLNSVSMRSRPFDYDLEVKRINGEVMFEAQRLGMAGIDFAPDSPGMPTYGVQILQEAANVEPILTPKKEGKLSSDTLTLETLRNDHVSLVQEIERPLRLELEQVTKERDEIRTRAEAVLNENSQLKEREARLDRETYASEIAEKFDPSKRQPVLDAMKQLALECKSRDEMAAQAMPIILEVLAGKTSTASDKPKSATEMLQEALKGQSLFPGSGNGQVITSESGDGELKGELAAIGNGVALEVPD